MLLFNKFTNAKCKFGTNVYEVCICIVPSGQFIYLSLLHVTHRKSRSQVQMSSKTTGAENHLHFLPSFQSQCLFLCTWPCDRSLRTMAFKPQSLASFTLEFTSLSKPHHFKISNHLYQHFMIFFFFFSCTFPQKLCAMPPSLPDKGLPDVHFKGFCIIKDSISLGWKLHCWFKHPAPSFFLPEHSSDDDICSNHWVMSHLMLSPTSNIPRRDGGIVKEAEEGRRGNWLPGLVMSGRRRKRLTPPSPLSHFRTLWDMTRLRHGSLPLIVLWE